MTCTYTQAELDAAVAAALEEAADWVSEDATVERNGETRWSRLEILGLRHDGHLILKARDARAVYDFCKKTYLETGGVTPELKRAFKTYQTSAHDNLTPDQTAALEAVKRKARAEGMREAAGILEDEGWTEHRRGIHRILARAAEIEGGT